MLIDTVKKYKHPDGLPHQIVVDQFQETIINLIELTLLKRVHNNTINVRRGFGTTVAISLAAAAIGQTISAKVLILVPSQVQVDSIKAKIKYFLGHLPTNIIVSTHSTFTIDNTDLIIIEKLKRVELSLSPYIKSHPTIIFQSE